MRSVPTTAATALVAVVLAACSGGAAEPGSLDVDEGSPRARVVAALPAEAAERGVYLLDPTAPEYPGSKFDALLPTADAGLLVETPAGPVALLAVRAGESVPAPAAVVDDPVAGRVAVLAPRAVRDRVVRRLGGPRHGSTELARLARSGAPFAWVGPLGGGITGLVELEGDRLRAELRGGEPDALATRVRRTASGSLPGSPGKRWADVVTDLDVAVEGEVVLVTARTVALPPALLRTLLDRAAGAGR